MINFDCVDAALGLHTFNFLPCSGLPLDVWGALISWQALIMPFEFLLGTILVLVLVGRLKAWAEKHFGG